MVAGGVAACGNFGSRFVFSFLLPYGLSVLLAYLVGMLIAFVLMREHVFDASAGLVAPQIVRFIAVNVVALAQTVAISLLLAYWLLPAFGFLEHAEAVGHLVGVLVPVGTSYFGHKLVTFR